MPISIHVHDALRLAVARCDGVVFEAEIHDAIRFSFEVEQMPGGIDRIVFIEPTADLRALDADALHRVQAHVFRLSGGPDALPAFRSVLVNPSPFHRPIAELYKAIWDSYQLPGVEFAVATTLDEGARLLGLPSSSAALLGLRPAEGGAADRGADRPAAAPGHSGRSDHC
jgi:hypothetical protein